MFCQKQKATCHSNIFHEMDHFILIAKIIVEYDG